VSENVAAGILPAVEPGFQPGGNQLGNFRDAGKSGADPGGRMPPSTADRDVCRYNARVFLFFQTRPDAQSRANVFTSAPDYATSL
jgi:hypothetical protein